MAAAILGAHSSPAFAQSLIARIMGSESYTVRFSTDTLPNGLRVLVVENRFAPIISAELHIRAGSRDDPPGRFGTAHLLEHNANDDRTFRLGAGLFNGAGTGPEETSYAVIGAANAADAGFYQMATGLGFPTFDPAKLKIQYDNVTAESNQRWFNYAYGLAAQCVQYLYWREGAACAGPAELEREARATSASDLQRFFTEHYRPDNAVLVVVGDISRADALSLATRYFGSWPRSRPPGTPRPPRPRAPTRRVTVSDRLAPAVRLDIAFATVTGQAPEFAAVNVLSTLLGRGGLLRRRLVDELHLFPRISTSGFDFRGPPEEAPLVITAVLAPGVEPDSGERAIMGEMARLAREPVKEDELERAKGLLALEFLRTTRDGTRALAYNLGYYATVLEQPELINSWLPMVNAVTASDLMSIMGQLLAVPPSVVVTTMPAAAGRAPAGQIR